MNNNNSGNNSKKLHGCIDYTMQPRNFDSQKCNLPNNSTTTISLKALAKQYLERNWYCNSNATKEKNGCNFTDQNLDNSFNPKYGISLQALKEFLNDDWDDYKDNPSSLELWADLLFKNHLIKQGMAPDSFTAITHCNSCGDVYVPPALVSNGNVLGCPWCWNRIEGLPISRDSLLK